MNSKYEGPFTSAFESDKTGVIKQELITYRVKDGMLRKETTVLKFNTDQSDWHYAQAVGPIVEGK